MNNGHCLSKGTFTTKPPFEGSFFSNGQVYLTSGLIRALAANSKKLKIHSNYEHEFEMLCVYQIKALH